MPTRKNAILDLILTNLQGHYENPQAFPPFGLSGDHNTVLSSPKAREKSRKTIKFVLRRDLCPSRKAELGRYLGRMDWRVLFTGLQSCEELLGVFQKVLSTGLYLLMPVKRVRIDTNDAPWMTSELMSLILKGNEPFTNTELSQSGSISIGTLLTGSANAAKQRPMKQRSIK